MQKPTSTDYPGFFNNYIALVPEETVLEAFNKQAPVIEDFLSSIDEERSKFSYAEGKWTIKEVVQHLIDAERIFCYRALCFSRKEKQVLPGFEENDYALNAHANERSWKSQADELLTVRRSTLSLFNSFTNDMLIAEGTANNYLISVTAIGFVTVGHLYHHINIIKERY